MRIVLALSIAIRLLALGWSIVVWRRLRDWRVGFLTLILTLMVARQLLTFGAALRTGATPGGLAELAGFAASILALLALVFFDRLLREHAAVTTQLQQGEAQFRAIAEHTPDLLWTLDGAGVYTYVSPAVTGMLGYLPSELLGKYIFDPTLDIIEDPAEDLIQRLREAQAGSRDALTVSVFQITKTGKRIRTEVRAVAIRDDAGRLTAIHGVTRDVTQTWDAEQAVRRSEQRLELALQGGRLGAYTWDVANGRVQFSHHITHMLGYDPAEVSTYADWAGLVHPEDMPPVKADEEAHFRGEREYYENEYRFRTKSGAWRWVLDRGQIVERDAQGHPTLVAGTFLDVSERHQAELALRESEARFRLIAERAQDVIWTMDADGVFTYISPSAGRLFGPAADAALGQPYTAVMTEAAQALLGDVLQALATGELAQAQLETTHAINETVVALEHNVVALLGPNGAPTGFQGISRDITERKAADARHRQLEAQLVQAQKMEAVGALASGIAHDFNNLLTAILGGLHMALLDLPVDSAAGRHLRQADEAAQRAAELTAQLLTLARKQELRMGPVDVNELVGQAVRFLRRSLPETIDVRLHLAGDVPIIRGDAGQIEQALLNLAINARDAMPGGGSLTFETGLTTIDETYVATHAEARPGTYVAVAVGDTGHGMPPAVLAHIFEPFYTTKELGKGTGLGLAMVYGCVHAHDGWINVYSEEGVGTSFRLYLPLVEAELAHPVEAAQDLPRGTETVLLADDTDQVLYLARAMLERLGYDVVLARNGEEAFERYRERRRDVAVVVTDLVMPRSGGRDLLRALRTAGESVPVIVTTGYAGHDRRDDLLAEGFAAFIAKPFTLAELAHTIRRVL